MSFLKVCANLSFLFTESSSNILERYSLAKRAGFNYVESGFPFGHSLEEVVQAKTEAGVNQILINIFTGWYFHKLILKYVVSLGRVKIY